MQILVIFGRLLVYNFVRISPLRFTNTFRRMKIMFLQLIYSGNSPSKHSDTPFFQLLFNYLTLAFNNVVKLISIMFKISQQCHD